ncbi:MAG: fluoride efflux transporter CrcB, partial [Gammaproteobacteria bacterium]|nr:fluoride efflux transporter CrcB [Gammaproteobacteria bacterium]
WMSDRVASSSSFPLGTFTVNVIGCFIIGLLAGLLIISGEISEKARLFVVVGFLGGFTTFSAFSFESLNLLRSGHSITALTYMLLTLVITLLVTCLGYIIGRAISG